MPLVHGKPPGAFEANVRTLMGEVGQSPHVQSRKQALAIAYAVKRRGHADGGYAFGGMPWTERAAARGLMHEGMISSPVPGRTDQLSITVGGGSYVVPAQHVAFLGQDNSTAGGQVLDKMFHTGPLGIRQTPLRSGMRPTMPHFSLRAPTMPKAKGGSIGRPVKIVAAGGEYVIGPQRLVAGISRMVRRPVTLDEAHEIMDAWIMAARKKHIAEHKRLKPPKKD